jgi:hypothetical protein
MGAGGPGYMYGFTYLTGSEYTSVPPNTGTNPSSSSTPTSTTVTLYPTNTAEKVGGAYCFNPSDSNYVQFTQSNAQNVVSSFCSQNYVLRPGNTNGFTEGYEESGYTVIAEAQWATDQTGCGTEQDFPFNANSEECLDGWGTDFYCVNEDGTETTSYGGAYVLEPPGNTGCLLISLYAYTTSGSKRGLSFRGVGHSPGPVVYNSTVGHTNTTALRQNATVPSVWPVSDNLSQVHRSHLFNQSMLALLVNGSAVN